MAQVFLELVLNNRPESCDLVSERQDLEDALDEALGGIAEVSGGGEGMGVSTVDIEVHDEDSVAGAIDVVRSVCRQRGWPEGAKVIRRKPHREEWTLY